VSEEKSEQDVAPSRQPGYFKDYYARKRRDILDKRRERYKNDPEYREQVKAQARAYRAKKAIERDKALANGEPVKMGGGPRRPVDVWVNGMVQRAWTVGHVAQRINRSVAFINHLTKSEMLPPTPFRSQRGDRLWTDAMILAFKSAVHKRGEVSQKDETFHTEVLEEWRAQGVSV